jgi:hypothetical protein
MEVWYATFTEPATGTGGWVHCEVAAPAGGGPAHGHGWVALFPPGRPPMVERFGPGPPTRRPDRWFDAAGAVMGPGVLSGPGWDVRFDGGGPPLWTFPAWAWDREVLPGAQVVPEPTTRFHGWAEVAGERVELRGAPGAVAHIYGHGNAERWGWLHADLGDGDVLEVVTAVSRRPGLRRLPPLALVQLRLDGRDWPAEPLAAAPLFRTRLGLPEWSVRGAVGRRRLEVDVRVPPEASVVLDYADPDGAPARCTNSERADAVVRLRDGGEVREWRLEGSAHAEVGTRD